MEAIEQTRSDANPRRRRREGTKRHRKYGPNPNPRPFRRSIVRSDNEAKLRKFLELRGCEFYVETIEVDLSRFLLLVLGSTSRLFGTTYAKEPPALFQNTGFENFRFQWPIQRIRFANGTLKDFVARYPSQYLFKSDFDPQSEFALYVLTEVLEAKQVGKEEASKTARYAFGIMTGRKTDPNTIRMAQRVSDGEPVRQIAEENIEQRYPNRTWLPYERRHAIDKECIDIRSRLSKHRKKRAAQRREKSYFDGKILISAFKHHNDFFIIPSPDGESENFLEGELNYGDAKGSDETRIGRGDS